MEIPASTPETHPSTRTIILVHSWHHRNTEKIALAMSKVLNAEVRKVLDASPEDLAAYGLVGFGAGIDSGRHYREMLDFADKLPTVEGTKAFIFSTAGITGRKKVEEDHKALRDKLLARGYTVVGEFGCRGFNTNSFLKYLGGMNRGRPNADDLHDAADFAGRLR